MDKGKYLLVALVIGLVALTGGILYKNMKKAPKDLKKLTVSSQYAELIDVEVLVDTANEQGYFKKNGVEVEKKYSNNNAVFVSSGEADLGIFPVPATIAGFYNNQNFKWMAETSRYLSSNYAVSRYSKNDINKIKTVGVMKLGNAENAVWPTILKNMGHTDTENLKFVAAPDSATKMALMEKNEVDIAFIQSFAERKSIEEKNKYQIFTPTEIFKSNVEMPVGIIGMDKVLKEKPDAAKGFTIAIYQAIEYIRSNKVAMILKMKSKYNLTAAEAETIYNDMVEARKDLNYVPSTSAIEAISLYVKTKSKPKFPDRNLNDLLFTDYASEAIKTK